MPPTQGLHLPYSLPDQYENQVAEEDDWTRATTRKEKKKIQNRVAQRLYSEKKKDFPTIVGGLHAKHLLFAIRKPH